MRTLATLGCLAAFAVGTFAQEPKNTGFATDPAPVTISVPTITATVLPPPPPVIVPVKVLPDYCPEQLLRMTEDELISVYRCGVVSPVPKGFIPGIVIFRPGSKVAVPTSKLLKLTAWQGKYITCDTMYNRQFGIPTIKAKIMAGESWIDAGPTLVFDYADTSLLWGQYRDEVREVSPGVYLGCMHSRGKNEITIATWFALDARCSAGCKRPPRK